MLVTVDSNVFINSFYENDAQHADALRLLSLADRGLVELQTTTRLDNDIYRDPWKSKLLAIPSLSSNRVGGPWRVGSTAIGGADMIVSESESDMLDELMSLLFPGASKDDKHYANKIHDVDHLFAHRKTNAVVFITSDVPILRNAVKLRDQFGIIISSLDRFLEANGWASQNAE